MQPGPCALPLRQTKGWRRRSLLAAGLVAPWSMLGTGCAAPEPLKLGFLGALTGRGADLGVAGRDGAMLAVEQANAQGGVQGRKLVLNEFDDRQQPDAVAGLRPAIEQAQLAAMVGPMTSSVASQWIPMANALGLTTVSPTVTSTDFSGQDDFFFTITSNTAEYARVNASYVVQRTGVQRLALLRDAGNAAYTNSWGEHFSRQARALGAQILADLRFNSGDLAQLGQTVRQALQSRPQAMVLVANAADVAQLAQVTRRLGSTLPLFASEWAGSEQVRALGGQAVQGLVFSQFLDPHGQQPAYLAFVRDFSARYKRKPGFAEVAAFDATRVVLQALAGRATGESLKQTLLRQQSFDGLQNPIAFDRIGDARRPVYMVRIQADGLQVL
jgi:branched-chain amino acid transport system substrate-binding protein